MSPLATTGMPTAAFKTAGIRVEALWPGQLVLPWEEGKWTVLVSDDNLTVRTGEWMAGTPKREGSPLRRRRDEGGVCAYQSHLGKESWSMAS